MIFLKLMLWPFVVVNVVPWESNVYSRPLGLAVRANAMIAPFPAWYELTGCYWIPIVVVIPLPGSLDRTIRNWARLTLMSSEVDTTQGVRSNCRC